MQKKIVGGVTVEASIALPLFLFFFMNLFSLQEALRFHGNMEAALLSAGKEYALYGSYAENGRVEGLAAEVFVKNELVEMLGREYVEASPVRGGTSGIFVKEEAYSGNDFDLQISYYVKPPFDCFGALGFWCENHFRGHFWKGYGDSDSREEQNRLYYVTKDSEVYHSRRTCTYIYLTIQKKKAVEKDAYRVCQLCKNKRCEEEVWVTQTGECYHTRVTCPALKRTVYVVGISGIEGLRGCSRCTSKKERRDI